MATLKLYILMALTALLISSAKSSVAAPKSSNAQEPVPANSMSQHVAAPMHQNDFVVAGGGGNGLGCSGWPFCGGGGGGGGGFPGVGCGGICPPPPKNPYYCRPVGGCGGNPGGSRGFIMDLGDKCGASSSSDDDHKS